MRVHCVIWNLPAFGKTAIVGESSGTLHYKEDLAGEEGWTCDTVIDWDGSEQLRVVVRKMGLIPFTCDVTPCEHVPDPLETLADALADEDDWPFKLNELGISLTYIPVEDKVCEMPDPLRVLADTFRYEKKEDHGGEDDQGA